MRIVKVWPRTLMRTWWLVTVVVLGTLMMEAASLSGPNVCMVQQKYNITKRVKYRAPMSVRSYEWCLSIPPRCSKWSTEMRDLTRLETEERTAEVAVCCPGYKMRDVSCIPICPSGKTGRGCSEDCPPNKWGPNCIYECAKCLNGFCSPTTGECDCLEGWQGESCQISMSTTSVPTVSVEEILTTTKSSPQTLASIKPTESTTLSTIHTSTIITYTPPSMTTSSTITTLRPIVSTTETAKALTTTISSTSPLITTTSKNNFNPTSPIETLYTNDSTTETTKNTINNYIYNRTETPKINGTSVLSATEHDTTTTVKTPITTKTTSAPLNTKPIISTTSASKPTTQLNIDNESTVIETTTKKTTTGKIYSSTIKFKPKEIWIKPTQKGETTFVETKLKTFDSSHIRLKSVFYKNETAVENTTPKTIIVAIIPTSVSHATFKKIALTTASYIAQKANTTSKFYKRTEGVTKSIEPLTYTPVPITIKILYPNKDKKLDVPNNKDVIQVNETINKSVSSLKKHLNAVTSEITNHNISTTMAFFNTTTTTSQTTNSMVSTSNDANNKKVFFSNSLTTKSVPNLKIRNTSLEIINITTTQPPLLSTRVINHKTQNIHKYITSKLEVTKSNAIIGTTKIPVTKHNLKTNITKTYATKSHSYITTTEEPTEDETFHILTEPEHITAVMSDKEREHTSVDLISVISIAGGVMMAVITVAVIIVMVERCKRPSYEDARKMNEIRMEEMIDSDEEPPPYVRSIFHTPLPDPPSEKCHYQPISTLDRNVKQFMRPVVVQTISPVMLENFRGILECHYDHLPRRNHEFAVPLRSSVPPSMSYDSLRQERPLSVVNTIEALKCEAKFDVIDNTTSEPLYAEIPCWRPPSEHAVEINLNGEAVTEL